MRLKKVIGIVGVIGSGKDYKAKSLLKNFTDSGLKVKIIDFSDAVREFTFKSLGINEEYTVEDYNIWKDRCSFIKKINGEEVRVQNRSFLLNIGGLMREYDSSFWAKRAIFNLKELKEEYDVIIFNSCRYIEEASEVVNCCNSIGVSLKFIFTNYKSKRYCVNRLSDSELFSISFLDKQYKHNEDITDDVLKRVKVWKNFSNF